MCWWDKNQQTTIVKNSDVNKNDSKIEERNHIDLRNKFKNAKDMYACIVAKTCKKMDAQQKATDGVRKLLQTCNKNNTKGTN